NEVSRSAAPRKLTARRSSIHSGRLFPKSQFTYASLERWPRRGLALGLCIVGLMMTSSFGFGATPPSEFAGIPWKASAVEAKRIISQREGMTLKEETPE